MLRPDKSRKRLLELHCVVTEDECPGAEDLCRSFLKHRNLLGIEIKIEWFEFQPWIAGFQQGISDLAIRKIVMLLQPIFESILAVVLQEVILGVDCPSRFKHEVFFGFFLVASCTLPKSSENVMRIHSTVSQPAVHEIHSTVEIDTRDLRPAGRGQLDQLLLELARQDLIGIE